MPRRPLKDSRSQDEARHAQEKAAGKNRGGRPRVHPGETQAERYKARDAKRGKERRERADRAFKKPQPPSPIDEPGIKDEVFGSGPPSSCPELVPDDPPIDADGNPLSPLWHLARGTYDQPIRQMVDDLMRRQKLSLDDLLWLEFAEHGMLLRERSKDTAAAALQSRKQMARILVARGDLGGVNDVPVRVPDGLSLDELVHPNPEGDNILAEPRDSDLPARYRQ